MQPQPKFDSKRVGVSHSFVGFQPTAQYQRNQTRHSGTENRLEPWIQIYQRHPLKMTGSPPSTPTSMPATQHHDLHSRPPPSKSIITTAPIPIAILPLLRKSLFHLLLPCAAHTTLLWPQRRSRSPQSRPHAPPLSQAHIEGKDKTPLLSAGRRLVSAIREVLHLNTVALPPISTLWRPAQMGKCRCKNAHQ